MDKLTFNAKFLIEDNYSSNVVVYIKYDYAKNHIESTDEGTSKKGSNSIIKKFN